MPEQRLVGELCEERLAARFSLTADGVVERIIFTTPGYCLNGVCIGDSFPQVRGRHPDLEVFLTRVEGGVLALLWPSQPIRFAFDTADAPGRCFERIDICSAEWDSAKVSAIIISSL